MKLSKGWAIAKVVGYGLAIAGNVIVALCDIPEMTNAIKDINKRT